MGVYGTYHYYCLDVIIAPRLEGPFTSRVKISEPVAAYTAMSAVSENETERAAVQAQLERILANSLFKNSKRYPNLLRYVVERTLDGHPGELKERTLGVEVFAREPDYDTNLDPVVRTTAAEIRKRLAQYYQDPAHESELRIVLPLGSYAAKFQMPVEKPAPAPVHPTALLTVAAPLDLSARDPVKRHWKQDTFRWAGTADRCRSRNPGRLAQTLDLALSTGPALEPRTGILQPRPAVRRTASVHRLFRE